MNDSAIILMQRYYILSRSFRILTKGEVQWDGFESIGGAAGDGDL